MTKNSLVSCGALALALTTMLSLGSCKKDSSTKSTPTTATEVQATGLPIALVRMDSVSSQYKYAQEVKAALEKDAIEHQTRLQSKGAAIQKAAADFERRMRINAFVSAEAQQAEQKKLIRMQQEGEALSAQLTQQLGMKQQLMLEDMMKEIRTQLKEYNKDGRYKLVLTQAGDNVLYADEALDITEDFIKYLNEHYTSGKATQAKADSTAQGK